MSIDHDMSTIHTWPAAAALLIPDPPEPAADWHMAVATRRALHKQASQLPASLHRRETQTSHTPVICW